MKNAILIAVFIITINYDQFKSQETRQKSYINEPLPPEVLLLQFLFTQQQKQIQEMENTIQILKGK